MNWRCADPVPHVLPLKLPFATHLRFPNPIVDPSSKPSPSYRSRPSPSSSLSFPSFQRPVAIISILLYHYNSSGNVRSFSRRSGPSPRATPFYNCFPRYPSILFITIAFTLSGEASPYAWRSLDLKATNKRGYPRSRRDKFWEGLKRMVEFNPLQCVGMHKDAMINPW